MSTDGLARFDTRSRTRTAQTDEYSQQTDLRTHGAREHDQLALNEIEIDAESRATTEDQANIDTRVEAGEPTRADFEVALNCARATIDGLREQVAQLEAEREQLRAEIETRSGADR
jgi:cell division protein FtsB